jgi:hypothetical protein
MKISNRDLRTLIKEVLLEQVVGYTPPEEKSGDNGDSDSGYETIGTMGKDISLNDDDPESQQASDENIKSLTQQRQQALDKGDTQGAETAASQLAAARKMRG